MTAPDRRTPGHNRMESDVGDVTPSELVALMDARNPILLDVREPSEWAIAHLPGARLAPLGELARVIPELDRTSEIVVYCHHGTRSAWAAEQLRAAGFTRVRNLVGGIDRWSVEVDPAVPRYR